ncbi:DUF6468 domain-containing protein [Phenylobacterium sp.]|jgi:hypothetical protein|uniref:DUF6468 domain-containing protein n=1 Tax=Phenylobacterium sp. TaxID=1871053 RepID=UPI002F40CC67
MSAIAITLNLLLAILLTAALAMGWRLNRRLIVLRDSHEGFAKAVGELDQAAQRAEQGLADLRAATDEATDLLADRIEKARALTQKLERLTDRSSPSPAAAPAPRAREMDLELELSRPLEPGRLGALMGGARTPRPRPTPPPVRREPLAARPRAPEDDLFDEPVGRMPISAMLGARR